MIMLPLRNRYKVKIDSRFLDDHCVFTLILGIFLTGCFLLLFIIEMFIGYYLITHNLILFFCTLIWVLFGILASVLGIIETVEGIIISIKEIKDKLKHKYKSI